MSAIAPVVDSVMSPEPIKSVTVPREVTAVTEELVPDEIFKVPIGTAVVIVTSPSKKTFTLSADAKLPTGPKFKLVPSPTVTLKTSTPDPPFTFTVVAFEPFTITPVDPVPPDKEVTSSVLTFVEAFIFAIEEVEAFVTVAVPPGKEVVKSKLFALVTLVRARPVTRKSPLIFNVSILTNVGA